MIRGRTARLLIAVACTVWMAVVGCRGERQQGPALLPVALPELSRFAEPVQQQLREHYRQLTAATQQKDPAPGDVATAYGEMGKLLVAAELLDAADACFQNARKLAPGDPRWTYLLAQTRRLEDKPGEAADLFAATLQLQPANEAALIWLGNIYLEQDRTDAAEQQFGKALSLRAESGAARLGLGRAALAKKQYTAAVDHLKAALELNPRASVVHYSLALAYQGLGQESLAEAELRVRGDIEIAVADPLMHEISGLLESHLSYEIRGDEALNRQDWPAALDAFRHGISLAPDNAALRHKLGTALFVSGNTREAIEAFIEALRLSPGLARAHYSLGIIMASAGRGSEAIDRFRTALKLDPGYTEAHLALADALGRSGHSVESLREYTQIAAEDPRVDRAQYGAAIQLVRLKRDREARDRLADGVKRYPDQPEFAHTLARLLASSPDDRVRDGKRALAILQPLLTGRAPTIEYAETMAMTCAELGDYAQAIAWQRQAIMAAERAGRGDAAGRMSDNLRAYEQRRPCRVPWRDDDPIYQPGPVVDPAVQRALESLVRRGSPQPTG